MYDDLLTMEEEKAIATLSTLGFSEPKTAFQNLRRLASSPLGGGVPIIIQQACLSPSPDDALNNVERIAGLLPHETVTLLLNKREMVEMVTTLCASSQMLTQIICRNPLLLSDLLLGNEFGKKKTLESFNREIDARREGCSEADDLSRILRHYREREYLRIGARDIHGLASLRETTAELSDLAGASLEAAADFCSGVLKDKHGRPLYKDDTGALREAAFVVLGMGKLGGGELNFSSDIDIIYLYTSDNGETSGSNVSGANTLSLHAFFVRLSEMITKMLGAVTEDGYVFRVDLDLRPEGTRGAITNSLRGAELYYESWGQSWERAAMIKARPVAGSLALGEEFLTALEPFIYRKHFDFTAIEEIKAMKERIDVSLLRKKKGNGDVKLGRGGIREIEFFIQALQLIHGGKDHSIRLKGSLDALKILAEKDYITGDDATILTEAYIFLRNLEHKIQIVEGRQTHAIPTEMRAVQRVAKMMGLQDEANHSAGDALLDRYGSTTERVHSIFETLFYKPSQEIEEEVPADTLLLFSSDIKDDEAVEKLAALGFREPQQAWKRVVILRDAPPFAHLSPRAHLLLGKIAPFLLLQAEKSSDPDRALENIEDFLTAIGGRGAFYSLLAENRQVMILLVRLFSSSLFLSKAFIEHPENIEILFSRELNKPEKSLEEMYGELDTLLQEMENYEESLDSMRRFANGEIIRIGINDLSGALAPSDVSLQLSTLADVALSSAYEHALETVTEKFGAPLNPGFAIIGLGKLGGRELMYSSDIDIVFIFSAEGENTDGPRVISAREFFAKVAQRIITTLSTPTKEGIVFKVDTRLRPSGNAGPLVTTRDAFLHYHSETAQVWERQSMLKARFICGTSGSFGEKVLGELLHIVFSRGVDDRDLTELYRIRQRMEKEIAKETPERRNIKTGRGGMVDIEFLAQTAQLREGARVPDVATPNTLDALERLTNRGALTPETCTVLSENYAFYTSLENRLRLLQNRSEGELVKGSRTLTTLARELGYRGENPSDDLFADYSRRADTVRGVYNSFMDGEESGPTRPKEPHTPRQGP